MVTKKLGRPKSDNAKDVQTRIRMTKEQANKLKACAEYYKTSKTDILMRGLEEIYKTTK